MVSHALDHLLFQHPQQLDLGGKGQVTDFVQKDVTPIRRLESAFPAFVGPGIGALHMTEKLAFQKGFVQRGTVDLHIGPLAPAAGLVDRLGDHLLARPALPVDNYRRVGNRRIANQFKHPLHRLADTDHAMKAVFGGQFPPETCDLGLLFDQVGDVGNGLHGTTNGPASPSIPMRS